MHFRVLVFAVLIVIATAVATPVNACEGDKSIAGYCDILSFTDRTTMVNGAPTVAECFKECRGILADGGDWIVDLMGKPVGYIDVKDSSPCGWALGKGDRMPLDYYFLMANQDIEHIIDGVIQMFGGLHSGRVAAEGKIKYGDFNATWYVN
ncbi:hypothetical protein K458DRAFT_300795 [Lentithecium fluviatile CBS 122367]|uniref:Ecp2 effector protein-like domain-containing protein n=1 Tax=Lentithecium fluviatile CBS 122367 TaxID=1168545 RepID=A0A6G1J502_9PLEO|nr:hypothetical protein K458DRAFT_300795 [Lentithecium fluviatile CBS 122367]